MDDFPFLFYGSRPGDWFEGANMGHFYELRFAAPPDADAKARLGRTWGEFTAGGAVEGGGWLWSGAWALVGAGERHVGRGAAFFARMEHVLRALHDAAPIAEVVFWGARGPSGNEWEAWTLAAQPTPTAGPVYVDRVAPTWYRQPRDASLAAPENDPAFDRAVAVAPVPAVRAAEPEPTDVDPRASADLDEAVARATSFFEGYTSRDEYFEDERPVLWLQYASANAAGDGIDACFACEGDPSDPGLEALVEKAEAALLRALPNLGYEIAWEITD
jgi:hypothetical protein